MAAPLSAEREELVRELLAQGLSPKRIWKEHGISENASGRIRMNIGTKHPMGDHGLSEERCRCGLRLPCSSCLDLLDFVSTGSGPAMPDGPSSILSGEVKAAFAKFLAKRGLKPQRLKPMRVGRMRP